MPLFFADLVREFSHSTGMGDFQLGGALPGHRGFAAVTPPEARFHYAIAGVSRPQEWETGEGEIGSGGALVRAPHASSAGGGLVGFSPGLKVVALTAGAAWYTAQEEAVAAMQAAIDGKADAEHDHDGAYQPLAAGLSAIAGLGAAADRLPYFTAPGAAALASFTSFARALVDDVDAPAGRATLGLGTAAVKEIGTSGDAVPVLNGGATAWAAGATFGGDVNITGHYHLNGVPAIQSAGNYHIIYNRNANEAIHLGGSGDPVNYYSNAVHVFRSISGLATFATLSSSGMSTNGTYQVGGNQVVGARRSGWEAPAGTGTRGGFDTASVTTAGLAERVKALIDDLIAHGLIGS